MSIKVRKISINDCERILSSLPLDDKKGCLRVIRQFECFDKIDRPVWFGDLTDQEKQIVRAWRKNWLDVTDTLIIPETPIVVLEKK